MKIEIFNTEQDGFQLIFIDGKFYDSIHENDNPIGEGAVNLLVFLNYTVSWKYHCDLPVDYIKQIDLDLLDTEESED